MPTLLIIQQVPHEGPGTFGPPLAAAGCSLRTLHAADPKAVWPPLDEIDGLIVMGGPQGVSEQARYPFLTREIALLRRCLEARRPILGVCLGAQLLAAALGAKVAKNPAGKEIGWYPLMREPGADGDPMWEPFGQTETVFQWHGDTFTLPKGAVSLASSPLCAQQAFRYGECAYGLQCHVEVTELMIRAWCRANAKELAALQGLIDPAAIRRQNRRHLPRLQALSRHVATTFSQFVNTQFGVRSSELGVGRRHSALRTPHSELSVLEVTRHARRR